MVSELNLHGTPLVLVSRILPVVLSGVLAWWVAVRLGPVALEAIPFVALITIALGLRLVFEQQLFGYYFMALSVSLVLLEMVTGGFEIRSWRGWR